jgi:hypothetical protein
LHGWGHRGGRASCRMREAVYTAENGADIGAEAGSEQGIGELLRTGVLLKRCLQCKLSQPLTFAYEMIGLIGCRMYTVRLENDWRQLIQHAESGLEFSMRRILWRQE